MPDYIVRDISLADFGNKEIAWQCGFPDEKYFMRLFRETEGMTPTAYRNAYHRTHVNNQ